MRENMYQMALAQARQIKHEKWQKFWSRHQPPATIAAADESEDDRQLVLDELRDLAATHFPERCREHLLEWYRLDRGPSRLPRPADDKSQWLRQQRQRLSNHFAVDGAGYRRAASCQMLAQVENVKKACRKRDAAILPKLHLGGRGIVSED